MAPRVSAVPRPGLLLSLGAALLVALSLAGGWWLGQRSGTGGADRSRSSLEREAQQLDQQLASGNLNAAEQQRLLELWLALGRHTQATDLLEQMADQQPERWQLRLLLAEQRRQTNDRSGAERELRQLLNLKPDRIEALQLMTLLQLEQGRGQQAQAQLKALIAKASKPTVQPSVLPMGLLLADLLVRQGQQAEAEALYTKLAADFARDPRPLLALALLKQQQGQTKAAQEALALARSRQPEKLDPRLDRVASSWGLSSLRAPSQPAPKGSLAPPAP
jgi:tetratricopeptide (TPR) repeat protein